MPSPTDGPASMTPRSRDRRRHADQRRSSSSGTASRRSPARPGSRPTSESTSTARSAGCRSRSRSTSRPTGPRSVFVTAGGDPPVAPATEVLTFDDRRPVHRRGRAIRGADPRRPADTDAARGRGREPPRHRADLRRRRRRRHGLAFFAILRAGSGATLVRQGQAREEHGMDAQATLPPEANASTDPPAASMCRAASTHGRRSLARSRWGSGPSATPTRDVPRS